MNESIDESISETMNAFINLYKPSGITSRDAINKVKRLLPRKTKIGHAGTLDPLAEGVLVTAIGSATKLIEYTQEGQKVYLAEFLLGRTSATEDVESEVTELVDAPIPTQQQLLDAANTWTGLIMQVPPAFSALKINGRRAYDLARQGQDVELAARPIRIDQARLLRYDYPVMAWEITCGSGTYVRAWGRDVARTAGSDAVMSSLTRTRVGRFEIDKSVRPDELTSDNINEYFRPLLDGCPDLPTVNLSEEHVRAFSLGQFLPELPGLEALPVGPVSSADPVSPVGPWAGIDPNGELALILIRRPDGLYQAGKMIRARHDFS